MQPKTIKFAHLADCHLGGWREPELQSLNFQSFQKAVKTIIEQNLDFVLISGDLFDSAYPPIDILKESFAEFKKLSDTRIPVYLIAGSHDSSASGKTFLDVLEKAGLCKNIENFQTQKDGKIKLIPTFHGPIAIYGYPGKKSAMEVEELSKVYHDELHPFTILMIHTTIKDVVGNMQVDSIDKSKLPLANYYAMGHVHKRFEDSIADARFVYPGPTYPNNFQELSDLRCGSFQIVETDGANITTRNIELPIKEVITVNMELDNGLTATQEIIHRLDRLMLRDKIVLLKLTGTLTQGKTGDIHFNEIEDFIKKKEAYTYLRNISSIKIQNIELGTTLPTDNVEIIERKKSEEFFENNKNDFNEFHYPLMEALSLEKNEDELSAAYKERLLVELKDILNLSEMLE